MDFSAAHTHEQKIVLATGDLATAVAANDELVGCFKELLQKFVSSRFHIFAWQHCRFHTRRQILTKARTINVSFRALARSDDLERTLDTSPGE
jgi:hypothetical protein